jgi:starch phosphorylase
MNALGMLMLYNRIDEDPNFVIPPKTFIFGAKAAPGYARAKLTIKLINAIAELVKKHPRASKMINVVFLENYCVSQAEVLIPATEVSEQISTAGKEASGTGNMKFMLNGAVTLGTMDGANVEIAQQVGEENIYIFGASSNQVIHRYEKGDYCAREWVEADPNLKRAISFLTGEEMLKYGQAENLKRLQNELINKDWFQTLPDFNAYVVRKQQAMADYARDPIGWLKKCLTNTAKTGFFSSDRTIAEYNRDIWKL